jgi:hypothetical protein
MMMSFASLLIEGYTHLYFQHSLSDASLRHNLCGI